MDIETRRIVIDAMTGTPSVNEMAEFLNAYADWRCPGQWQNISLDEFSDGAGRRLRAIFDPTNPDSQLANARMRAVETTFDTLADLISGYSCSQRERLNPQTLVRIAYGMAAHRMQEFLALDGMVSGQRQPRPGDQTPVLAGAAEIGYAC